MVCYSQFPKGGDTPHPARPQGKHQGWSGGKEVRGKWGQERAFAPWEGETG